MSFAKVYSAQTSLLKAHIITVEVDLSRGLHSFSIVGLPDKSVEEAKDRISAAIKNSGYDSPKSKNQKVVVSLAPAHIKKEGAVFDLAIALAYLLSGEEIDFDEKKKIFLGELSLDGRVRPIQGVLLLVLEAKNKGFEEVYVPKENALEAALVKGINIFAVETLGDIIDHLNTKQNAKKKNLIAEKETEIEIPESVEGIDFFDIRGQEKAKRGLEIAAAGGHNIAMYGPPGTGKTMLAKAFAGLLPPLSFDQILETTSIHSVAGVLHNELIVKPPFRSPHHTSSYVSLVGGGTHPKPGEVTLAHNGVLFMDEFPEFERRVIDALRQPLEDRVISISRVRGTANFPAHFILIATMNPCPCGNFGSQKSCICSPTNLMRYQKKISGPIIDRIDMWVEVGAVKHKDLSSKAKGENTETMRKRIADARNIQSARFKNSKKKISLNSHMSAKDIETYIPLEDSTKELLNTSAERFGLSARSYHRILKLARTIADLDHKESVKDNHILEALQYRPKQSTSL